MLHQSHKSLFTLNNHLNQKSNQYWLSNAQLDIQPRQLMEHAIADQTSTKLSSSSRTLNALNSILKKNVSKSMMKTLSHMKDTLFASVKLMKPNHSLQLNQISQLALLFAPLSTKCALMLQTMPTPSAFMKLLNAHSKLRILLRLCCKN